MAKKRVKPIPCNPELIARVSLELGIPESLVQEVSSYQGIYTATIIREGAFESVRWPYVGQFTAKMTYVKKVNEKQGEIDQSLIQTPK